jgi:predicted MFS family arabinose efflux permease
MKNKAWMVTLIVFCAGVTFSIGNFKVAPAMVDIIEEMDANIALGGWLMSMSGLAGIILALPAGAIMIKTGPKKLGMYTLAFALIGNIIGAVAPNFTILLLSRLIEGIGYGFIGIIAPAIIAAWFPPRKLGLPMSIGSIWVPLGIFCVFNLSNLILPTFGWRGVWWLAASLFAAMMVLFGWGVQLPEEERGENAEEKKARSSMMEGLKSFPSWLIAICFVSFAFGTNSLITFAPTFLVEKLHMDGATANSVSSIFTLGNIIGGLLMGIVLTKFRNRAYLLLISMVSTAILMSFIFSLSTPGMVTPYMIIFGLVAAMFPAIAFTVAPETAPSPETIGIAIGILILGQNVSNFITPAIIGTVIESSGGNWGAGTLPLIIAGILGVIAALLFLKESKQKEKSEIKVSR